MVFARKRGNARMSEKPELADDRVFLCILVKGLFKGLPWKTKQIEGDFDDEHYIISVEEKEMREYNVQIHLGIEPKDDDFEGEEEDEKPPQKLETPPAPVTPKKSPTTTPTKRRGRPPKKKEVEEVKVVVEQPKTFEGLTVIQEGVFVNVDRPIFSQKIVTGEESSLQPGAYLMTHAKRDGVSYLGTVIDGWFIGQQLAKWQMYVDGHFGSIKVTIENLQPIPPSTDS